MRDRHDIHIAGDVTSALGMIFAGGPIPALAIFGLITLACLGLQAFAHPGAAFAGAGIVVLPFVAWRVGRVRSPTGRLAPARLAVAGALLLGAVGAYQLQWGLIGRMVDESQAEACAGVGGYGYSSSDTSRFLGCRSHMTRDQFRQGCARLLAGSETRTMRLILLCD